MLAITTTTLAAQIHVNADGTGDYPTIQVAIDAANPADEIVLEQGKYTGDGNRDIDFLGKAITVRSTDPNDPNITAATIIDCNGSESDPHRGFYFHNDEDANSILDGLTICNGYGPGKHAWGKMWSVGGAILCESSNSKIVNCIFKDNSAALGGAIFCEGSSPTIAKCTFRKNLVEGLWADAGAIYCRWGSSTITKCEFVNNSAEGHYGEGGAIYCDESNTTITDCVIRNNKAFAAFFGGGGGIYCYHSNDSINGCTISNNKSCAGEGGGGGAIYCDESNPEISNCLITGNIALPGFFGSTGGGIRSVSSSPIIINCTIGNNRSYASGGGISIGHGKPKIFNSNITGNLTRGSGGGISCSGSNSTITNCTISGNTAGYFGGGLNDCEGPITNCTITGNLVYVYRYAGGGMYHCKGPLTNCILWDNWPDQISRPAPAWVTYSNVQGGWAGEGNIAEDPRFVSAGSWADVNDPNIAVEPDDPNAVWFEGDYHLLRTSPCIDAANDANVYTDIEGNLRPFDFPGVDNNGELPDFDMGAYEATALQAYLRIVPRVINRRSRSPRVMAILRFPEGITRDQIDRDEPLLLYPAGSEEAIEAARQFVDTGQYFYGTDTIWIKPPPRKPWWHRHR